MPVIGEFRRGHEIGYKNNSLWIWHACEGCGKERWVTVRGGAPKRTRCLRCGLRSWHEAHSMELSPHWDGGREKSSSGYIKIKLRLSSDNVFAPMMDKKGCIFEHSLVMAKELKRCLTVDEMVHHKNGIRDDNRIVNLALVKRHSHPSATYISLLQNRIRDLEGKLSKTKML